LDHITERKKKVVCRTATRVAVGFKCEIAAASSRCPPLHESVRNLELSSMRITSNVEPGTGGGRLKRAGKSTLSGGYSVGTH
jgi:hypothetical protein